jgi:hypothetical protein
MILNQPVNRLIRKHGGAKMAWYDFTMGRFWHGLHDPYGGRLPLVSPLVSRLADDL